MRENFYDAGKGLIDRPAPIAGEADIRGHKSPDRKDCMTV